MFSLKLRSCRKAERPGSACGHPLRVEKGPFVKTSSFFLRVSGHLLKILGVFLKIRGVFLKALGLFLKTLGLFLKTPGLFLKTPGFFLKTLELFLKTPGFFLKTPGFFLKTRGLFLKTSGLFHKTSGLFHKTLGLFHKPSEEFLRSVSRLRGHHLSNVLLAGRQLGGDLADNPGCKTLMISRKEIPNGTWVAFCKFAEGPRQGLYNHIVPIIDECFADA